MITITSRNFKTKLKSDDSQGYVQGYDGSLALE